MNKGLPTKEETLMRKWNSETDKKFDSNFVFHGLLDELFDQHYWATIPPMRRWEVFQSKGLQIGQELVRNPRNLDQFIIRSRDISTKNVNMGKGLIKTQNPQNFFILGQSI